MKVEPTDIKSIRVESGLNVTLILLTGDLRKAEDCHPKVRDLKTYRNEPLIDMIGRGQKLGPIPLKPKPFLPSRKI